MAERQFLLRSLCWLTSLMIAGCANTANSRHTEAERLVRQLSWSSVDGGIGWMVVRWDGPVAERLMQIGPPAAPALISVLQDPDRGVAAHIILTSLFQREQVRARQRWLYRQPRRYHTAADLLGVAVRVNGLEWTVYFNPTRYHVSPEDLRKNAERWRRQLPKAIQPGDAANRWPHRVPVFDEFHIQSQTTGALARGRC